MVTDLFDINNINENNYHKMNIKDNYFLTFSLYASPITKDPAKLFMFNVYRAGAGRPCPFSVF